MAYQSRPNHENHSPVTEHERRSPWVTNDHHGPPASLHYSGRQPIGAVMKDIMDPESEDSDVSEVDGDITSSPFPINLPPALSKQGLESSDTISSHLSELERVENHNIKKHNRLREKRTRKDDKIARKRAAQDEKVKAIMNARARRDSRIKQRRQREDIAFQRFYEDLEEEENRLRQRLKRMKRGLPLEDAAPTSRRVSINANMSPPGPAYSTIPPPSKRHQTSHLSQVETPVHRRPSDGPQYPPTHQPSYQFYPAQNSPIHPQASYTQTPQHPHQGHAASPPLPSNQVAASRSSDLQHFPPPRTVPSNAPLPSAAPVPNAVPTPPPIRQTTTYDTRPPPPMASSGFAAVNQPPIHGFAAVNARPSGTPPPYHAPARDHVQKHQSGSTDQTPARTNTSEEKAIAGSTSTSKRTPSTTHPYQMSEAFANRHHHCEKTDSLNRGIWTWYGFGGTQDHPTASPTEMYLRCNHDGCRRIDWRTVHGLQCHIVKNHEQPKGTIGSLEKALDKYGVPVSEVEEVESREGLGAGGTMADPKNTKLKTKLRESGAKRAVEGSKADTTGIDLPHLHKLSAPNTTSSHLPTAPYPGLDAVANDKPQARAGTKPGSESTPIDIDTPPQVRPMSGFAAVNTSWQGVNATLRRPVSRDHEVDRIRAQPISDAGPHSVIPHVQPEEPPGNSEQLDERSKAQDQADPPSLRLPVDETSAAQPATPSSNPAPISPEPTATPGAAQAPPQQSQTSLQEDHLLDEQTTDEKLTPSQAVERSRNIAPSMPEFYQDTPTVNAPEYGKEPHARPESLTISAPSAPSESKEQYIITSPRSRKRRLTADDDAKISMKSPEATSRRILPPRRESHRTSVATTASSKIGGDKQKDEEMEDVSRTNPTSKTESVDDDSDSITVNTEAIKAEQRERDEDKTRTPPPRRLANGRFMRRNRGVAT